MRTEAKLLEVSEKARDRVRLGDRGYVHQTVLNAAAAVERGGSGAELKCSRFYASELMRAPPWCIVVQTGSLMASLKRELSKGRGKPMPRASVSFPPELYKTLEDLARRKKVSIAWVVRDAVEKYVADQWPLLAPVKG